MGAGRAPLDTAPPHPYTEGMGVSHMVELELEDGTMIEVHTLGDYIYLCVVWSPEGEDVRLCRVPRHVGTRYIEEGDWRGLIRVSALVATLAG